MRMVGDYSPLILKFVEMGGLNMKLTQQATKHQSL